MSAASLKTAHSSPSPACHAAWLPAQRVFRSRRAARRRDGRAAAAPPCWARGAPVPRAPRRRRRRGGFAPPASLVAGAATSACAAATRARALERLERAERRRLEVRSAGRRASVACIFMVRVIGLSGFCSVASLIELGVEDRELRRRAAAAADACAMPRSSRPPPPCSRRARRHRARPAHPRRPRHRPVHARPRDGRSRPSTRRWSLLQRRLEAQTRKARSSSRRSRSCARVAAHWSASALRGRRRRFPAAAAPSSSGSRRRRRRRRPPRRRPPPPPGRRPPSRTTAADGGRRCTSSGSRGSCTPRAIRTRNPLGNSHGQLDAQLGAQFSDALPIRPQYFHWLKQKAAGGPCTDMAGFAAVRHAGRQARGWLEMDTIFTTELPARCSPPTSTLACSTGRTRSSSSSRFRGCSKVTSPFG